MSTAEEEFNNGLATLTAYPNVAQTGLEGYGSGAPPVLGGPWANGAEFAYTVLGLFLALSIAGIACKKLRKKSPAFDHFMLAAAEDIDAGTPYVTALLAGLVIAANIMLLVGILRTLDAFVGIGAHIQAGTAQVDGMLVVFQANIQVANETFLNYSAIANDTLTAIRAYNQEAATLMFDDIIPNAAGARAHALLQEHGQRALSALVTISIGADAVSTKLLSFTQTKLPFANLAEDVNQLSYVLDQIASAVNIMNQVADLRSKYCLANNCTGPDQAVARVVRTTVPDIDLKFIKGLEIARTAISTIGDVYSDGENSTIRGLMALLPNDIQLDVVKIGVVQGGFEEDTQSAVDAMKVVQGTQMLLSPLYKVFAQIENDCATLQSMLNLQVKPALSQA